MKFLDWILDKPSPTTTAVARRRAESLPATISIEDKPEDSPLFKRIYTAKILRGITVAVTMYQRGSGYLYSGGELTQADGHWVLFDPDRIADKIIDPELVPVIRQFVEVVKAADREYRRSQPMQFIDERGTRWLRG